MRVFGTILAGGQGMRMGGADKALLMLGGMPLLARCVARLAPQVVALAVSANGDPARLAGFGLPILADPILADPILTDPILADPFLTDPVPGFSGPLAGILAGMIWAEALGADALVTVAVDTPFFPTDLVARLLPSGMAVDAAGLHPTFALWPIALRPALAAALAQGERRVADFATASGIRRVLFSGDRFFNINRPEDLAAAEVRLA